MVQVVVGSGNASKITAVRHGFTHFFKEVKVSGKKVDSGVPAQPMNLEEMTEGAQNRAERVFGSCDYSVGIESGLFRVPRSNSGYMDCSIVCIYDGKRFGWGTTPSFEYPLSIVKRVLEEGKETTDVMHEVFPRFDPEYKSPSGNIGFLSKQAMPRTKLNEWGVVTALMPLVNRDAYGD